MQHTFYIVLVLVGWLEPTNFLWHLEWYLLINTDPTVCYLHIYRTISLVKATLRKTFPWFWPMFFCKKRQRHYMFFKINQSMISRPTLLSSLLTFRCLYSKQCCCSGPGRIRTCLAWSGSGKKEWIHEVILYWKHHERYQMRSKSPA